MSLTVRGVEMHYYAICHRKLWLFHRGLGLENDGHDRVIAGKILHDRAYPGASRELQIDEYVKIDREEGEYLREIKLTGKMKRADRLQMLYYLYILKEKGVIKKGLLSYTKEKKTEEVILDEQGERKVKEALLEINKIVKGSIPAFKRLPYCGKCAYKDFCLAGEVDEDGT